MRRPERQQDRCHVNLAAKSNKMGGNSHGFEFSRTLSCKKNSHKEAQKAHKQKPFCAFCAFLWRTSGEQ